MLVLAACANQPDVLPPAPPSTPLAATQIAWQRSLDDALRLAAATQRPLFVAVNMDGESASERIVRENYRDPAFVARTRECICVIGSLFRHSPRDYDEQGRRIPCPRLGSVTCGEHIALEPVLFEKLLKGERVAPRHVFLAPGGKKAFDESLLFDIRDLDRMLADALGAKRAVVPERSATIAATTQRPFASARARHEQRLAEARDTAVMLRQLAEIGRTRDAGWGDALRRALFVIPQLGDPAALDAQLVVTAQAIGAADALVQTVRDALTSVEAIPTKGRLPLQREQDARLLRLLRALDPVGAQTRTWRLGRSIVIGVTPPPDLSPALRTVVQQAGGAFDLAAALSLADAVAAAARDPLPRPSPITDAMPTAAVLLERLEQLDGDLTEKPGDVALRGALAKTTLDLARRRIETGAREVPLLLEDAARLFRQALAARPERADWWIEAARTAYFQQDFVAQSRFARRALALRLGAKDLPHETSLTARAKALHDGVAIEALRWVGDAEARLVATQGAEPDAVQARGMLVAVRALGVVAASPFATAQDWIGLVSLIESLGLVRASLEVNLCGAERLPADAELRQALRSILWSIGRITLEPAAARRIAARHTDSGTAVWFVGYAHLLAAEDRRRAEQPDAAIAEYARARQAFGVAAKRDRMLAASCRHYIGVAWLGSGMAHLLAVRQPEAAKALAAAANAGASIRAAKDGLQRDVFDLVDQSLEWRAGRPSPVDAVALLDQLERADPATAFWAGAVSDTMLREGLRADGKNPERVVRETVDASGETIRMPMGRPTKLGDTYLEHAIAAGRRANRHGDADRKPLAQALTIRAERALERLSIGAGDAAQLLALARRSLREAAPLYGVTAPGERATREELGRTAGVLRAKLGPARPRFRDGR